MSSNSGNIGGEEEKWELTEAGMQAEASVSVDTVSNSVTGQYVVFTVTYTNKANGERSSCQKHYKDFAALHRMLVRRHPTLIFPQLPPKLNKLRISEDVATSRAAMFTSYLSGILSMEGGVQSCQELVAFFSQTSPPLDPGLLSALGFLLQAVTPHVEEVRRGSTFCLEYDVAQEHIDDAAVLIWQFRPEIYDIALEVVFIQHTASAASETGAPTAGSGEGEEDDEAAPRVLVLPTTRYNEKDFEQGAFVQGSFEPDVPGKCVFTFDNSYSRMRSKALSYNVEIVSGDAMDAARTAAADTLTALHRRRKLGLEDRDADVGNIMDGVGLASNGRRESDLSDDGQSASSFGEWLGKGARAIPGVGRFIPRDDNDAASPSPANGVAYERIGVLEDDLALMAVRRDQILAQLQVVQGDLMNEQVERRRADADCATLRSENERLLTLVADLKAAQESNSKDARRMDQMEDERRAWQVARSTLELEIAGWAAKDQQRSRDMDGLTDINNATRVELAAAKQRIMELTDQSHVAAVEIAQLTEQRRILATDVRRQALLHDEAQTKWQLQADMYAARDAKAQAQVAKLKAQKKILVAELRKVANSEAQRDNGGGDCSGSTPGRISFDAASDQSAGTTDAQGQQGLPGSMPESTAASVTIVPTEETGEDDRHGLVARGWNT